jgi:hypothetical protein
VQRAEEKLAEHRHPGVVVERNDRSRGKEKNYDRKVSAAIHGGPRDDRMPKMRGGSISIRVRLQEPVHIFRPNLVCMYSEVSESSGDNS